MEHKVRKEQNKQLIKNIIVLGSTGCGKSSTCNTICDQSDNPFFVDHNEVSGLTHSAQSFIESKNIMLYDTPGFGDCRLDERNIDKNIRQVLFTVFNPYSPTARNTNIDAFFLVLKIGSHAPTLRTDIERIIDLFGPLSLKSLLFIPIYEDIENIQKPFLEILHQDKYVLKILKEVRNEEPNEDWFCIWNNIKPSENQEQELFSKIRQLPRYTNQQFIRHNNEIEKYSSQETNSPKLKKLVKQTEENWEKNSSLKINSQKLNQTVKQVEENLKELKRNLKDEDIINIYSKILKQRIDGDLKKDLIQEAIQFFEEAERRNTAFYSTLDNFFKENKRVLRKLKKDYDKNPEKDQDPEMDEEVKEMAWSILKSKNKADQAEKTKALTNVFAKKGFEKLTEKGKEKFTEYLVKIGSKKLCNIF